MKTSLLGSLLLAAMLPSSHGASTPNGFAIFRGVNISHWLSQMPGDGFPNQELLFTEMDAAFLASAGFDHIRLPVDESELWDEGRRPKEANWARLAKAVDASLRHRLVVVLDLHVVRSHHFNAGNEGRANTLFTDPEAQRWLLGMWREISSRMRHHPDDRLAYEILNEAVAEEHGQWNDLLALAHGAIRELEPERTLVLGSNRWQAASTFPHLKVPAGDPNLILSFHSYEPMLLTHYRASWVPIAGYEGPVRYPGRTVEETDCEGLPEATARAVRDFGGLEPWSRERMEENVGVAVARAKELGLPLYCGEFGCMPSPGRPLRLRYYRDAVSVFEQFGLARANWDYKGGFQIVDPRTLEPDLELIQILTGWTARR